MATEISVKGTRRKGLKLPLTRYIVIFLIAFLASASYFSDYTALRRLGALVGIHRNFVIPYKKYTLRFENSVPTETKELILDVLDEMELDGKPRFALVSEGNADLVLGYRFDSEESDIEPIYTSYFVPVGHLYWVRDDVTQEKLYEESLISKENSDLYSTLLVNAEKSGEFNESEDLLEDLIESEDVVGLVDISELTAEMKLLTLDGHYFLDDPRGGLKYSLGVTGKFGGPPDFIKSLLGRKVEQALSSTFDSSKLAKVNMTGVTAITRALTTKIDNSGDPGYAAKKIGEFLADADLTHVSNEVSFVPGCTPVAGVRFCSKVEHLKNLEDSGVDIVELTGNHNNDYGASYNASTIEMYTDRGWDYFGGGLNAEDASKILYKEVKGTKIAFIGYDYYDTMLGTGALAGEERAGANSYSESKMKGDIEEARENADVVIVDFQFQECYSYPSSNVIYPICYKPLASPDQKGTFRKAVGFGADIVIGTQAHQPQTYEIYEGKLIFYGLGNLYFDQIYWIGTMHGLVLSHYMYDGKLIQTRITTTNYDGGMQTYVSTDEERKLLLELLRDAR